MFEPRVRVIVFVKDSLNHSHSFTGNSFKIPQTFPAPEAPRVSFLLSIFIFIPPVSFFIKCKLILHSKSLGFYSNQLSKSDFKERQRNSLEMGRGRAVRGRGGIEEARTRHFYAPSFGFPTKIGENADFWGRSGRGRGREGLEDERA